MKAQILSVRNNCICVMIHHINSSILYGKTKQQRNLYPGTLEIKSKEQTEMRNVSKYFESARYVLNYISICTAKNRLSAENLDAD